MLDFLMEPNDFEPYWMFRHPHAQTTLGSLLPSDKLLPGSQEHLVDLPDSDRLSIWHHHGSRDTMVHIWHGLGGHAESGYMRRLTKTLSDQHYHVLRCNHRGCGSGRGQAKGIYHSGRGDDQGQVIHWARQKWPHFKHILLGFSLSGNAALFLAGKIKKYLPDAIIAVNAPIDLQLCSEALILGFNKVYDVRFTRLCKKLVRERVQDGLLNPINLKNIKNLAEFDDRVTAPLGGFKNRFDYYKTCSAGPHLRHIEIPTKILTAEDDPFVPVRTYHQAKRSPLVHLQIAKGGGHMGYLGKKPFRWMDKTLLKWIQTF